MLIGKSKKLGKIKKKKQVVAADLSSDRGEENRGDDAEVYQMSSGDEDFSNGMKGMILISENFACLCCIFTLHMSPLYYLVTFIKHSYTSSRSVFTF